MRSIQIQPPLMTSINLKRSRDGTEFVPSCVCLLPLLHSVRFGHLLRCAHKRIVNIIIMKVYMERKNMQLELIQFRKKISRLFTFNFLNR